VTAAERWVTRKGEFAVGREYANAVICKCIRWPQKERRLAQIGPIGECCHLRIGQRISANNDGQRIASQWL
jgi:hypothetical protein